VGGKGCRRETLRTVTRPSYISLLLLRASPSRLKHWQEVSSQHFAYCKFIVKVVETLREPSVTDISPADSSAETVSHRTLLASKCCVSAVQKGHVTLLLRTKDVLVTSSHQPYMPVSGEWRHGNSCIFCRQLRHRFAVYDDDDNNNNKASNNNNSVIIKQ
jgi:hypothetical protein